MVFGWIATYLANQAKLVDKLAASYPIRRAAQLVVYLLIKNPTRAQKFIKGDPLTKNSNPAQKLTKTDPLQSPLSRMKERLKKLLEK